MEVIAFFSSFFLHSGSTRRAGASWTAGFAWSTCKPLFFYLSLFLILLFPLLPVSSSFSCHPSPVISPPDCCLCPFSRNRKSCTLACVGVFFSPILPFQGKTLPPALFPPWRLYRFSVFHKSQRLSGTFHKAKAVREARKFAGLLIVVCGHKCKTVSSWAGTYWTDLIALNSITMSTLWHKGKKYSILESSLTKNSPTAFVASPKTGHCQVRFSLLLTLAAWPRWRHSVGKFYRRPVLKVYRLNK